MTKKLEIIFPSPSLKKKKSKYESVIFFFLNDNNRNYNLSVLFQLKFIRPNYNNSNNKKRPATIRFSSFNKNATKGK